jgi:hypothetical protein
MPIDGDDSLVPLAQHRHQHPAAEPGGPGHDD